ncbi:Serine/threonine-protein phosphatase 4 regulatory subunit 2 [Sphaceloma murrayae]|uniref:Serine/threonine-protein phosphatase 4 regulatory subunit 2 n=1 Tax=Sphaceloma murrayae TaxID=2082308 RepID=A0A2K1QQX9_9PEZI|nr:Serine/threonine-protein phosphatase 4 regulatory subunit 2 [Sphaceloma murrayae]
MATTQELLEVAARDGSLDISEWPRVLENVLQRLHDIVYTGFPFPSTPTNTGLSTAEHVDNNVLGASPVAAPSPSQRATQSEDAPDLDISSQLSNTNKENAVPEETREKAEALMGPPPSRTGVVSSQDDSGLLAPYPDLAASYKSSIGILKTTFANSPPYTVQRLAELVLEPRRYFRFLPSFLNALDRIVSVSSSTNSFPLLQQVPATNGIFSPNGEDEKANGISGDEGLGGALLTPIPWLRNTNSADDIMTRHPEGELHSEGTETIEGPNGAGHIETVSVTVNGISSIPQSTATTATGDDAELSTEQALREQGAVTQGELIRQEQEAGVVPVAQATARRHVVPGGEAMASVEDEESEEGPHARGPEEIGISDLGPQEGTLGAGRPLDLEAALGRRSRSPQPPVEDDTQNAEAPAQQTNPARVEDTEEIPQPGDDSDYVLVDTEMTEQ